MAKSSPIKSLASRLFRASQDFGRAEVPEVERGDDGLGFQTQPVSTAALLGGGARSARSRQLIYDKWQAMIAAPLVGSALRVHVTAALGGNESTGQLVFIETDARFRDDKQAVKLVEELNTELSGIFNRIAPAVTFNGVAWGDAYARLYPVKGVGLVNAICDEMMLPPLVQPYEQGEITRVCQVACGKRYIETLAMDQIARLKMPRLVYVPQPQAVENAWRTRIAEDDFDKLPLMPSLAGGSFLIDAEDQFDKFIAAVNGLVGQRVMDSIDESIVLMNVTGMTKEQRSSVSKSATSIFQKSKELVEKAITAGTVVLGRVRHLLPVYGEKQVLTMQSVNAAGGSGAGRAANVSIDDVMFHAKMLGGALGVDVSMLGFADLLSGGLGDGGFFRTSVQSAERARIIRGALSDFFNHLIDVHLAYKTGVRYAERDRPWRINYFGSISSLETERQKTESDAFNAASLLAATLAALKELGIGEEALTHILANVMKLDEADAKLYAKALVDARKAGEDGGGGGFGGGGFGGPPRAPQIDGQGE